jgi:protocatechuate 3,4-dioxygenase beta subunit
MAGDAVKPWLPAVLAALAVASAAAQTSRPTVTLPATSGVIRGRVVTADGRPLPNAIVRALGDAVRMQRGGRTDDDGRYQLNDLAGDTYTISLNHQGYFVLDSGRVRAAAGRRVVLHSGEVLERTDLVVAKASAITGRVTDEDGEPIEGAEVRAMQVQFANGRRQLMEAGRPRHSNDLGQFRLFGLQPGQYVISVMPAAAGVNRLPGYSLTYYPGSPRLADTQVVAVPLGRDANDVDIRLSRGRNARVSGTALGADGRPLRGYLILANSQRSGGLSAPPRQVVVQADGTFEIPNVSPGEYVLQSLTFIGDAEAQFATGFVTVGDRDVTGLALRASFGSTLAGRIVLEGETANVTPSSFSLVPFPADFDAAPMVGNGYSIEIRPDWTFDAKGVFGPLLLRLRDARAGWMLKSVRVRGSEVTDTPLTFEKSGDLVDDVEVVLTNRSGAIAGTVADARSQPVADATVIVFARDRERWYRESRFLKYATASPEGSFAVSGLPPAEYFVAAVDWMDPSPGFGEWQDPEVLEALARHASRVRIRDDERVQVSLKLIPR